MNLDKIRKIFHPAEISLIKLLGTTFILSLIGVITLSVLGAKEWSLHLISLEVGWVGQLFDMLSIAICATGFFILGLFISRMIHTEENDSEQG